MIRERIESKLAPFNPPEKTEYELAVENLTPAEKIDFGILSSKRRETYIKKKLEQQAKAQAKLLVAKTRYTISGKLNSRSDKIPKIGGKSSRKKRIKRTKRTKKYKSH